MNALGLKPARIRGRSAIKWPRVTSSAVIEPGAAGGSAGGATAATGCGVSFAGVVGAAGFTATGVGAFAITGVDAETLAVGFFLAGFVAARFAGFFFLAAAFFRATGFAVRVFFPDDFFVAFLRAAMTRFYPVFRPNQGLVVTLDESA